MTPSWFLFEFADGGDEVICGRHHAYRYWWPLTRMSEEAVRVFEIPEPLCGDLVDYLERRGVRLRCRLCAQEVAAVGGELHSQYIYPGAVALGNPAVLRGRVPPGMTIQPWSGPGPRPFCLRPPEEQEGENNTEGGGR